MVAQSEQIVVVEAPAQPQATSAAQPAANRERARSQKGEPATEHTFDPATKKWNTKTVWVTLEGRPFTEGSMRWCFRLVNHSMPEASQKMVGKMYKAQGEPRATYFTEVEMQANCANLAEEYNKMAPPKKIKFIIPKVLEFHHRRWNDGNALIMAMEPMLAGEYKKHSNNYGYVNPVERNTPQAFSHFTYVHTKGQMLVCDMQGVEDTYTDPQIHTPDLRFGIADMGTDGMQKFFQTHRCNAICQHLGLPQTSFKPTKYSGTVCAPRNTSPSNNFSQSSSFGTSGFPVLPANTSSPSRVLGSPVASRVPVTSPQQKSLSPLTSSAFSTSSFMPLTTDTSMLSYVTTPFYSSFGNTTSYMPAGITA